MKLSPSWAHAIAVVLAVAGAVLHFLQTNPSIASEVHLTANAFLVAGFLIALASQTIFGTPTPPAAPPLVPPGPAPSNTAAKIVGIGGMMLFVPFMICVWLLVFSFGELLAACTPAQASHVTNAVFTVDQAACLAANQGLAGNSTAVQDFEAQCGIASSLDQAIQQFIANLAKVNAAKAGAK